MREVGGGIELCIPHEQDRMCGVEWSVIFAIEIWGAQVGFAHRGAHTTAHGAGA